MKQKTLFFLVFIALSPLLLCAESSPKATKPSNYRVQKGDCLWNISKQLWKNPNKWPLLYAANQDKIKNPNLIFPGQKFALPDIGAMTKADLAEATRLAYSKMGPLPSAVKVQRPSAILKDRSASTSKSALSKETSSNPIQKPEEKAGLSAPQTENTSPITAPVQETGSIKTIVIVAFAAVALAAIIFFIQKKPTSPSPQVQPARSLSSFSQVDAPPRPQTPSSDMPVSEPPSRPATTPPPLQEAQPPMVLGTITSASIPSTPQPEAKPVQSAPPANIPSSAAPQGPQNPTPPLAQPGSENEPQRPPDNTPPASSNHAA